MVSELFRLCFNQLLQLQMLPKDIHNTIMAFHDKRTPSCVCIEAFIADFIDEYECLREHILIREVAVFNAATNLQTKNITTRSNCYHNLKLLWYFFHFNRHLYALKHSTA